jgi:hypothetical protein
MTRLPFATALVSLVVLTCSAVALADVRITDQKYVRHDGGSDAVIANCFNDSPGTAFGGNRQGNEPSVAIKPDEPKFIVASANDYCTVPSTVDAWEGVYVSKNGGGAWTDSLLVGYPGDTSAAGQASPLESNSGDPILDWDNFGNLFVGGISFNRTFTVEPTSPVTPTNGHMYVATYQRDRAAPLGIKFLRTVIVGAGTPGRFPFAGRFNDKPSIRVDDGSVVASRFAGNVYVAWTLFPGGGSDQVLFARSSDHGATFSKPIIISKNVPNAQGSDIAVAPNGTVYVFWRQFAFVGGAKEDAIVYVKSTDGGKTFSDPQTIRTIVGYDRGDAYVSGGFARDCGDGAFLCVSSFVFHRWDSLPQAIADGAGNLYVTWEEVTLAADNGDTYHPDGQSQVVVSKSTNGGATWSTPVKADSQPAGQQFAPNLAFDRSSGTLALIYWDSREDPSYSVNRPPGDLAGGRSVCGVPASAACDVLNTFIATSFDGINWTSTKVSTVGHQPEYEMFGDRDVPFHGDYNWVDAAGGTIFGAWADNRDVLPGSDPRESVQDGFDVLQCRTQNPDGSFSGDTCANAGGLNQNIFGAALSTP